MVQNRNYMKKEEGTTIGEGNILVEGEGRYTIG